MVRKMVLAAMAIGVALVGNAQAGARKKKEKVPAKQAAGILVSASLEGTTIQWKVTLDDEGEKVLAMASPVAVRYKEKNDKKLASQVRTAPKKPKERKGKTLTAQGAFVKAEAQGKRFAITLKVGEGENAAEQTFLLPSHLRVTYKEGAEQLTAMLIKAARKGAKAEKAGKQREKDAQPPENL